jgi:hypothetical protein
VLHRQHMTEMQIDFADGRVEFSRSTIGVFCRRCIARLLQAVAVLHPDPGKSRHVLQCLRVESNSSGPVPRLGRAICRLPHILRV